ncbi:hypothetical protein FNV43_RR00063 [Rhamnella rubrinervis]|uniref:Uncharacterized protein n=1 Tax=Rhamnella rubrinervis TaxID=2594499 RepID=A0A8K0MQU9_9ROSA|nr:hypothetical protein FNV43_RR00063 [Rhamnella rubrinervis]
MGLSIPVIPAMVVSHEMLAVRIVSPKLQGATLRIPKALPLLKSSHLSILQSDLEIFYFSLIWTLESSYEHLKKKMTLANLRLGRQSFILLSLSMDCVFHFFLYFKRSFTNEEVSSGLRSRIEFAKNQPEANRNYKNLLLPGKIAFYFSRETLFNGGHLIQPNMTTEGMKNKLSEMRKSGAGENRGNDRSGSSQSTYFCLFAFPTSTIYQSYGKNIPFGSPQRNRNPSNGHVGYMGLRQQAYMTQTHFEINDLRQRTTDQKATLSEFEKKAMLMDNEVKLNEETIQKLQDSLSKSKARMKELESDVIESKEKSTRALQGLESLKSSTDETIKIEVAQQLSACLS